ncbi:MAG: 30S ribosomal protein S18 [bacterium]
MENIDFRDTMLLRKFVTQHGKIVPSRITGATATQQREIARAIRRARVIGIMP